MEVPKLEDGHIHRSRNLLAWIISIIVLFFLGIFTFRVVFFTKQLRLGNVDLLKEVGSAKFTKGVSEQIISGVPEFSRVFTLDDPMLGKNGSPLTIVEFADFQCPYSAEVSFTLRELAAQYPDQLVYQYRDFPLPDLHPLAFKASIAGECAHRQGAFWEYHDKLYQNQSTFVEEDFLQFAKEVGLNTRLFSTCMNDTRVRDEVVSDLQDGTSAQVTGTPTFFINGTKIPGAIPKEMFETLVQDSQK